MARVNLIMRNARVFGASLARLVLAIVIAGLAYLSMPFLELAWPFLLLLVTVVLASRLPSDPPPAREPQIPLAKALDLAQPAPEPAWSDTEAGLQLTSAAADSAFSDAEHTEIEVRLSA
jgi:hypothetical protein